MLAELCVSYKLLYCKLSKKVLRYSNNIKMCKKFMQPNKIVLFKGVQIRKTIFQNEWWFVINDVVAALTDSDDPSDYFKKMKLRDPELARLASKGGDKLSPPFAEYR